MSRDSSPWRSSCVRHVRQEGVHDVPCCLRAFPARGKHAPAAWQVLCQDDTISPARVPQQAALPEVLGQHCKWEPRGRAESGARHRELLRRALMMKTPPCVPFMRLVCRWRLARSPAVVREAAIGPPHVEIDHDGHLHLIEYKIDSPLAAQSQVRAELDARTLHRLHDAGRYLRGGRNVAQIFCATRREELVGNDGDARAHHVHRRRRLTGLAHHLLEDGLLLCCRWLQRCDCEAAMLRRRVHVAAHLGHDAVQIGNRRVEANSITTRSGGGLNHERHGRIEGLQPRPRLEQLVCFLTAEASWATHDGR
mmetsp:Transcript_128/g.395  ORF Transcript_128/g.395 Transcript_128/m.395 type:complete len:309 (+) Transcript_128:136-1062(+)